MEFTAQPVRTGLGVRLQARVTAQVGVLQASVPLRVDLVAGDVKQTVYATTRDGLLSWEAPFLKQFPEGPVGLTVTDLASGKSATAEAR